MFDSNNLGLCCGSLVQADFRGLAEAASTAGFRSITLWPTLFESALAGGLSETDLRSILADNGLHITELDPFCSWLPIDPGSTGLAGPFAAFSESYFFRMADALGARTLNVIHTMDQPIAQTEVVDLLAGLCERARAHDLLVSIEFLPWSSVDTLQAALALVEATGQENCGVNIDTWHHFRSGGTIGQLEKVDATRVAAIQFNDVAATPWEDVIAETSSGRLLPGQGASDAAAVLRALWEAGVRAPLNVEVFNAELMALPPLDAARKIHDATLAMVEQARIRVA